MSANFCVAQEERGILPVGMLSHCSWPTVDHVRFAASPLAANTTNTRSSFSPLPLGLFSPAML